MFGPSTVEGKSMTETFTWIPFYEELATRLISYEDQQTQLISFQKHCAPAV